MTTDEIQALVRTEVRQQLAAALAHTAEELLGADDDEQQHPLHAMSVAEAIEYIAQAGSGNAVAGLIEAELANPAGVRRSVLDAARIRLDELRLRVPLAHG